MTLAEGNGYTTIIGRVINIDHEKELIVLAMEAKKDEIMEFSIKIGKSTNYIYVRDIKGLLSVGSFKELKFDDDVSIKCNVSKGEYKAVEIEKIYKVKNGKSTEEDIPFQH